MTDRVSRSKLKVGCGIGTGQQKDVHMALTSVDLSHLRRSLNIQLMRWCIGLHLCRKREIVVQNYATGNCTLYIVQCTVYIVQCTVYNLWAATITIASTFRAATDWDQPT